MGGTAYSPVAAGSPGPFERKTPSGFSAMMSSAEALAATTVTVTAGRGRAGELSAGECAEAENVGLGSGVERDDVEVRICLPRVALVPGPGRFVPGEALAA